MKRQNVEPYDVDLEIGSNGKFVLEFTHGSYPNHKKVRLHFDDWWVGQIAEKLHKVIDSRARQVEEMRSALRGVSK